MINVLKNNCGLIPTFQAMHLDGHQGALVADTGAVTATPAMPQQLETVQELSPGDQPMTENGHMLPISQPAAAGTPSCGFIPKQALSQQERCVSLSMCMQSQPPGGVASTLSSCAHHYSPVLMTQVSGLSHTAADLSVNLPPSQHMTMNQQQQLAIRRRHVVRQTSYKLAQQQTVMPAYDLESLSVPLMPLDPQALNNLPSFNINSANFTDLPSTFCDYRSTNADESNVDLGNMGSMPIYSIDPGHVTSLPCQQDHQGLDLCADFGGGDYSCDLVAPSCGNFDLSQQMTMMFSNTPSGNTMSHSTTSYGDPLHEQKSGIDCLHTTYQQSCEQHPADTSRPITLVLENVQSGERKVTGAEDMDMDV